MKKTSVCIIASMSLVGSLALSGPTSASAQPVTESAEPAVRPPQVATQTEFTSTPVPSHKTSDLISRITIGKSEKTSIPISEMNFKNIRVGAGWYVYIYLKKWEFDYLQSIAFSAVGGAVCVWLGGGVVGGVACSVIGGVVAQVVNRYTSPRTGYCRQIRMTYAGTLSRVQDSRSYC